MLDALDCRIVWLGFSVGILLVWTLSSVSRRMMGGSLSNGLSFNCCSVCQAIIAAADKVFV
jgi:hypothetical protein